MTTPPPDIDEVFFAALQLPPEEREPFVRKSFASHPDTADLVVAMLRFHACKDGPLDKGIIAVDPERIGPYRILRRIGKGGWGIVYQGKHDRLERKDAVKVLSPLLVHDKKTVDRFRREAQLLAKVKHPNIVQVYDFDEADGHHYVAMELIEGPTLAELAGDSPLQLPQALDLFVHIAEGVRAAHAQGIVHRDLKPQNILIDGEGRAKVVDFGIATSRQKESLTHSSSAGGDPTVTHSTARGTDGYSSPEQRAGQPVDHRTDIWAFGCVMAECLMGTAHWRVESAREGVGPKWPALPRTIPRRLRELIQSCLQHDREKRPSSMDDVLLVLRRLQDPPRRQRTALVIASIVALAIAFVWVGVLWLRDRQPIPMAAENIVSVTARERMVEVVLADGTSRFLSPPEGWNGRIETATLLQLDDRLFIMANATESATSTVELTLAFVWDQFGTLTDQVRSCRTSAIDLGDAQFNPQYTQGHFMDFRVVGTKHPRIASREVCHYYPSIVRFFDVDELGHLDEVYRFDHAGHIHDFHVVEGDDQNPSAVWYSGSIISSSSLRTMVGGVFGVTYAAFCIEGEPEGSFAFPCASSSFDWTADRHVPWMVSMGGESVDESGSESVDESSPSSSPSPVANRDLVTSFGTASRLAQPTHQATPLFYFTVRGYRAQTDYFDWTNGFGLEIINGPPEFEGVLLTNSIRLDVTRPAPDSVVVSPSLTGGEIRIIEDRAARLGVDPNELVRTFVADSILTLAYERPGVHVTGPFRSVVGKWDPCED
ncbi:MAG: serine/threonine protein kinase [Candidatus Eisenbacteria bacterium]|uniref:Serine/threonine protein kinase n=1 Tax=Eiseniibacteriota bacterium TaxID=2212470 RepID=A0A956NFD2_UNCEI|nr:serine/threonine protein kinase [Candidatus Eisenbacteria bacterium]MCB9465902.1 serine/threonine protein kinase [Candidatus Eisenbacteria bacterium]